MLALRLEQRSTPEVDSVQLQVHAMQELVLLSAVQRQRHCPNLVSLAAQLPHSEPPPMAKQSAALPPKAKQPLEQQTRD